MKLHLFVLIMVILLSSACMCLECTTLSPEEIEKLSTAMGFQNPSMATESPNPTVICYGDVESDAWSPIHAFLEAIHITFNGNVTATEANTALLDGYAPYEALELESLPACLILSADQVEVFRTYDDFSLETFEPKVRDLLGN